MKISKDLRFVAISAFYSSKKVELWPIQNKETGELGDNCFILHNEMITGIKGFDWGASNVAIEKYDRI